MAIVPRAPCLSPVSDPAWHVPDLELPPSMTIVLSVDHRERGLIETLADVQFVVKTLLVGDLMCEYEDGRAWIAERKCANDLAKSITTGHWREQVGRLHSTGCQIFFLIEGDLRSTNVSHASLLGACINAEMRQGSHVIRTMCLTETAAAVHHLVQKGGSSPGVPASVLTTPALSKRQRDDDCETCWVRQLMCIPSISEQVARKLLSEFGNLPALQKALGDEEDVKKITKIHINDRACIGKTRIQTLKRYLLVT